MTESTRTRRVLTRTVGVVASLALAGGAVVATSPSAEAANVWDRVAKCESGGNWKINTGNGYYGGLQFSSSTWKGFGGRKYAGQAHKASKAEQIAVAKKVLKSQGPGAWPVCSKRAGLTKSNGGAAGSTTTTKKKSGSTAASGYVTVHSGDTLSKLAKRYNVKGGWKGLWKLNKSKIKNPNQLKVGWKLRVR